MAFDYMGLTKEFIASGCRKFIDFHPENVNIESLKLHAYGSYAIEYSLRTSSEELIDLCDVSNELNIVNISRNGRHVTVKFDSDLNSSGNYSSVILTVEGTLEDNETFKNICALAIQNNTCNGSGNCGMSANYITFELIEDNGFIHVQCEHEARALYETLEEKVGEGLKGLSLAYDKASQDIVLMDGEGNVLDQANITPQVSGVDPSGIVYTEGVQFIKEAKIWSRFDPVVTSFNIVMTSDVYMALDGTPSDGDTKDFYFGNNTENLEFNQKVQGVYFESRDGWIAEYQGKEYRINQNWISYDADGFTIDRQVAQFGETGNYGCLIELGPQYPKLSDFVVTDEKGRDSVSKDWVGVYSGGSFEVHDIESEDPTSKIEVDIDSETGKFSFSVDNLDYEVSLTGDSPEVTVNSSEATEEQATYAMNIAVAAARALFLKEYKESLSQINSGGIDSMYRYTQVSDYGVETKLGDHKLKESSEGIEFWSETETGELSSRAKIKLDSTMMLAGTDGEGKQVDLLSIGNSDTDSDTVIRVGQVYFDTTSPQIAGAPAVMVMGHVCDYQQGEEDEPTRIAQVFPTLGYDAEFYPDTSKLEITGLKYSEGIYLVEIQGFGNLPALSGEDKTCTPVPVEQHLLGVATSDGGQIEVDLTIVMSWFSNIEDGYFVVRLYDFSRAPRRYAH